MKNMRSAIMLTVALLSGLLAVVLAVKWIQQNQATGGKIAVAMLDIPLGSRIASEGVSMVDWPAGSVPAGSFADRKALDGRVAMATMTRGEPILESKLAPVGTQGGLSAVVGEGKRAITVRVNDVIGVAGFALPGNYVDIMVNTQGQGAKNRDADRTISKIVLEHILVLAVAQEAGRDETKPKVVNAVTLEVTPEQAEKLDLARSVGSLSLVLRNQVDQNPVLTKGATKDSLLASGAPPRVVKTAMAARPRSSRLAPVPMSAPLASAGGVECVEVIRGPTRSQACF